MFYLAHLCTNIGRNMDQNLTAVNSMPPTYQPWHSWFAEATMLPNKIIVVSVNEHLLSGLINEGLDRYKPGDPGYEELLRHVGGLKIGQSKLVPPWGPPR